MKINHLLLSALLVGLCSAPAGQPSSGALQIASATSEPTPRAILNRTLPKVTPPPAGLEFSSTPTEEEISRARVFDESLAPIGGRPSAQENADLASAFLGYTRRSAPDDFTALTAFLERHPNSPWRAAVLTCLGIEYYNTAYYSRALAAWEEAWLLGQKATNAKGKFLADRTVCELAGLYSRLGRMNELEALLKSIEKRTFIGGSTERINMAREALWMMQNQPGRSFRCGPLALQSILRSDEKMLTSCGTNAVVEIFNSASTQKGFSLTQVAELSKKAGLDYQMVFRGDSKSEIRNPKSEIAFVVPSVVHWKAGHYAAIVRREGDQYLVEDPTFVNRVWATKQALETEASGYFLVPPGEIPRGWRVVDAREGATVWGKGVTSGNDPDRYTPDDLHTGSCSGSGAGMAVASVHLMLVNLSIKDTPVGYTPPVGPPVHFTLRYNHRDYLLPPTPGPLSPLGPGWTHDWIETIRDNPGNPLADIRYSAGGGGAHTYSSPGSAGSGGSSSAVMHRARLTRPGTNTYEMIYPDGSKKVFGQRFGASLMLTRVEDSAGNAVVYTYDNFFRLASLTDAIGQVTTLSYENTNSPYLLTKVTDPFGRFATIDYATLGVPLDQPNPSCTNYIMYETVDFLDKITDVLGLQSRFTYTSVDSVPTNHSCEPTNGMTDLYNAKLTSMTTPYGETSFALSGGPPTTTNTRIAEIHYPDGSRERVEYNQSQNLGIPGVDPVVPAGVTTFNANLFARNTYYWSRTACASSYGDYSKARIYHWLHTLSPFVTSGVLECMKEPLESRVWYNYPDQTSQGGSSWLGSSDLPTKIGRVLDDGQTQLYTRAYNEFGRLTNSIDPIGRTLTYVYATNGIDLLEVRQTRTGDNELIAQITYNGQHRPLTSVDAAGQTNTFTYNARGQPLTRTNPKGETTTFIRDADGRLGIVDGPLAGTADRTLLNYDIYSRVRAITDSSGYRIDLEYDDMDRVTRITYPDNTFELFTYDRLNLVTVRDRGGRQMVFEYDNMRQMKKKTDPLGRVTLMDWCRCGQIKSLTDPMGRTTAWLTDVEGRNIAKQYADGSRLTFEYEKASSRLRQVIDEKQQVTQFTWNRDDTLKSLAYFNTTVPTPGVSYTYDPNYQRVASMTDGTGTTLYSYNPVTDMPALGAGALASVDGPLPNDTITYNYDELGRPIYRAINGVGASMTFDDAGRLVGITNALGAFTYGYEAATARLVAKSLPNGQTEARSYGNNLQDRTLQRITHALGATPVSEFLYGHDITRSRITTWSQQAGAQSPNLFTFGYDSINQLLSASVANNGNLINTFAYAYDPAGNRLTEQVGPSNYVATFNALNQLNTSTAPGFTRTNEWDGLDRLVATTTGNQRTEFAYDGHNRRVSIRHLTNGVEASFRRFVWCGGEICEERDAAGVVTKRFFPQGMKVEAGPSAGNYFYTRDHLGSIRELTDSNGSVRARYGYDPYGRRTKITGDVDADFGFAGMFFCSPVNLSLTHFRAYDPELARWLSCDPLPGAEMKQGPNLYAYVGNEPISRIDPEGLSTVSDWALRYCAAYPKICLEVLGAAGAAAAGVQGYNAGLPGAGQTVRGWQPAANATRQCAQVFEAEAAAGVGTSLPASASEFQVIRAGADKVYAPITGPEGERIFVHGRFADTWATAETELLSENAQWAEAWFDATVEVTRTERYLLPQEEAIEAFRTIVLRHLEIARAISRGW